MKYLTLRERHGMRLTTAAFCLAPITHRQLAEALASTHEVVGAGFVELDPLGGTPTCFGYSDSLGLGPAPGDAELIRALHRQTLRLAPAPGRSPSLAVLAESATQEASA